MKKLYKLFSSISLVSLLAISGHAQTNTFIGIYGGTGLAFQYNYNMGISGGLDFLKGIGNRTALGATLFYQGYSFLYDNEAYGAKNGTGNAGVTLLNQSSYIFSRAQVISRLWSRRVFKVFRGCGGWL